MGGKHQITHSTVTSQLGSKGALSTARPLARWILCVVLLAAAPLWAQLTVGGIAGTVKDPSGAVVPKAQITITNEATKAMQTEVSNSVGTYVFSAVPVGTYTLKVSAQGFKGYVDTGIQIHIQNMVTADIRLLPGTVTETVTVTSIVPLLQAQDASLGQTVPTEQVNDLPLNGRNWLSLAQLSAGSYSIGAPGSSTIFANGAEPGQVDVRINGTDNNNEVFGGVNVAPVPDAIQEFKLQDGNNSAQFGQFAGSVINAEIKSGTNLLRGNVWEYWRNEALNANGYFNNQHHVHKPKYRQNQFGGTIGGPVYIPHLYDGRNKTFFFFDYQHSELTQQSPFTETIPTQLMQSSGFSNLQDLIAGNGGSAKDALGRTFSHGTVLDPATTRSVGPGAIDAISGLANTTPNTAYVRDPFFTGGSVAGITDFTSRTSQLNIIPQRRLDPNVIKLMSTFPNPTSPGLRNNYYAAPVSPSATDQYDIRADQHFGTSDLLWGVFSWSKATSAAVQPYSGPIGEILGSQANNNPHYVISLHYSHVFSPEMENEMTGGYAHEATNLTQPDANTLGVPAQYGVQGIPQFQGNGGLPAFVMSGISNFGGHGFRRYWIAVPGQPDEDARKARVQCGIPFQPYPREYPAAWRQQGRHLL
jgi:Carboxypeptidase regulatory-like domain